MNKTEYNEFVSAVQNMIFNFISEYDIPAACKLQQSNDDDIQWTLNLGKTFGSVNILIESWEHASYRGKVNVCFIPMKFHTYRDNEKLFLIRIILRNFAQKNRFYPYQNKKSERVGFFVLYLLYA